MGKVLKRQNAYSSPLIFVRTVKEGKVSRSHVKWLAGAGIPKDVIEHAKAGKVSCRDFFV